MAPREELRYWMATTLFSKYGFSRFTTKMAKRELEQNYTDEIHSLYSKAARGGREILGIRLLHGLTYGDNPRLWLSQLVTHGYLVSAVIVNRKFYLFKEDPNDPTGTQRRSSIEDLRSAQKRVLELERVHH